MHFVVANAPNYWSVDYSHCLLGGKFVQHIGGSLDPTICGLQSYRRHHPSLATHCFLRVSYATEIRYFRLTAHASTMACLHIRNSSSKIFFRLPTSEEFQAFHCRSNSCVRTAVETLTRKMMHGFNICFLFLKEDCPHLVSSPCVYTCVYRCDVEC